MSDKEALIIHTSFSNLVLSEAFHTPANYLDRIVFPDGLSGFRNLTANILKERSGLIPTVVAVINNILVPIRKMNMTEIEYLILMAIIFFDPGKCNHHVQSTLDFIQLRGPKNFRIKSRGVKSRGILKGFLSSGPKIFG
jgi:hypothetical protein